MASIISWLLVMLPFFLLKLLQAAFYFAIAVAAAALLLYFIRRQGSADQLPRRLIWQLVAMGLPVAALTFLAGPVIMIPIDLVAVPDSILHTLLRCFLSTALVEEGAKLLFLKLHSWKHPTFTQRFHGIVYAACVGLGFAAAENVMYMLTEDVSTTLLRGVTAVPVHLALGVLMGTFYGRAKMCERAGDAKGKKQNLWRSLLLPAALHGASNSLALNGSGLTTVLFFLGIAAMTVWSVRQIKREAAQTAASQIPSDTSQQEQ